MTFAFSSHTPDEIWRAALGELELVTTPPTYETWLKPTYAIALSQDLLTIGTPSAYGKDWLENKLASDIRRVLTRVCERAMDFQVQIGNPGNGHVSLNGTSGRGKHSGSGNTSANGADTNAAASRRARSSQPSLGLDRPDLNQQYVFSNFIVGSSNRLAYAAAMAVAEGPGSRFNPLFLYGGVGLGKTHLLQAIGHHLTSRGFRVRYVTTETFTNDLITAIRTQSTDDFRNRYRQVDVLLLDDIQFLTGKEQTQEEVFHTFNAMHSANRQIVISSDRPPGALITLEARLRSRFEAGLSADIQPPDLEMRLAILRSRIEHLHATVPDEVVQLLAHRVATNIRELTGALTQVIGYAQLMHEPLTLAIAEQVIANSTIRRPVPSLDDILRAVSQFYRVPIDELTGDKRLQRIVRPRHIAMYLMREDGQASLPQIGNFLNRDHTTVLHGIERIAKRIDTEEIVRKEINAIRETLYSVKRS